MHSSGHAQGSSETQEDRVALLLDVLAQIDSDKRGQTETQEGHFEHVCGSRIPFVATDVGADV